MPSETTVSKKNQTVIPRKIRKSLIIEPGDILKWQVKGRSIVIRVRKKVHVEEIKGLISVGGDAVSSKKSMQRGNA